MNSSPTLLYFTVFCVVTMLHGAKSQCNNEVDNNAQDLHAQNQNTEPILKDPKLRKLVEQKFLEFMGLKEKPDASLKSKVKVPNEMWKLYCKWSNENYNDPLKNDVDNVRLVDQEADIEADMEGRTSTSSLRFNMSGVKRLPILHRAELMLFTESSPSGHLQHGSKFVRVFDETKNDTNANRTLIAVRKVPRNKNSYVKIDVTSSLIGWFSNSTDDTAFQIRAEQDSRERRSPLHTRIRRSFGEKYWLRRKPLLFLYTSDVGTSKGAFNGEKVKKRTRKSNNNINGEKKKKKKKHSKRTHSKTKSRTHNHASHIHAAKQQELERTHSKAQSETCRLRPYYLDFVKLGWSHWIIAPRGYHLNYCRGECPRPLGSHYNTTNAAVIQNIYDRKIVPPLCCIPTSLKDQTFFYMDPAGELSLRNPADMSAEGCGCR